MLITLLLLVVEEVELIVLEAVVQVDLEPISPDIH
jgi:hypothetical protein